MAVNDAGVRFKKLKNLFLKEQIPFVSRREVNWRAVGRIGVATIVGAVIIILILPAEEQEQGSFHEKADVVAETETIAESTPSDTAATMLEQSRLNLAGVPRNFGYLYSTSGSGSSHGSRARDSSMIIARPGLNSKTQVPAGSRIRVKFVERAVVAEQAMPVIGFVSTDLIHEDVVAIPSGSKVFGEVSFDESTERAQVSWRSIQMPDGRERKISAIGVSANGQAGIDGKVHSEALKNALGQTLTRFIGAYAEGSIERGALGSSPGGSSNGFKNAVAETARDQAEGWAEGMRKEKRWIEIKAGTEANAVLKEPFTFRDPGGYFRE